MVYETNDCLSIFLHAESRARTDAIISDEVGLS